MIETDKTETLAIKISPSEMVNVDRAWKRVDGIMNRSQFIKLAINSYAGEEVCKTRSLKTTKKQRENQ